MKRRFQRYVRRPGGATAGDMRRVFEIGAERNRTVPADVRLVPVETPTVRGEWILARGVEPSDRAILYVHGGGFVACSPLTHRRLTVALARRSGAPVFAVDYRRAPEHRFPAALDDVVAAYDALCVRLAGRGIAIAGDSAGGNLALAAAMVVRDRNALEPAPLAAVVAFSPFADLLGTGTSVVENARSDDMLTNNVAEHALKYVDAERRNDPLASPLYGSFANLPPLLLFASRSEVLRDDAVRVADRARAQRVAVELVLEDDMPHVWPLFYGLMPEAERAVETAVTFLRRAWSRETDAATSLVSVPLSARP